MGDAQNTIYKVEYSYVYKMKTEGVEWETTGMPQTRYVVADSIAAVNAYLHELPAPERSRLVVAGITRFGSVTVL